GEGRASNSRLEFCGGGIELGGIVDREIPQPFLDLLLQIGLPKVGAEGVHRDDEARRYWKPGPAHLSEVRTLAAHEGRITPRDVVEPRHEAHAHLPGRRVEGGPDV